MDSLLATFPHNSFPAILAAILTFREIFVPPFLAAILNFCVKHKNAFISEMVQDREILTKLFSHRVFTESIGTFSHKSFFRPILASILNICVNTKMQLSWKPCQIEQFRQNFYPPGIYRMYWPRGFFPKIIFTPILAAIMNFCI